jgi:hypothetical protein
MANRDNSGIALAVLLKTPRFVLFLIYPKPLSMQKYLILLLVALVFLACNKNDHDTYIESFPTVYSSAEFRSGPVRLFAKSGEITDINSITAFIDRRDAGKLLYFGKQLVDSFYYQIWMKKPDSVSFFIMGIPYKCSMVQSGNARLLIYKDTLSFYANNSYEGATYFMQLRNGFSNYQPLYETLSNESFPKFRVKPVYPMRRTSEGMEVTTINSLLCQPFWHPIVETYVNTLNANGYSQLAENDSLLIQERVLVMKKRNW